MVLPTSYDAAQRKKRGFKMRMMAWRALSIGQIVLAISGIVLATSWDAV